MLQEQFEEVVPAVIKTVLDFLQIHREVIFGHAPLIGLFVRLSTRLLVWLTV